MKKEQKIILAGMIISGMSLFYPSLFKDKSMIALNLLVFISSSAIVLTNLMNSKNINLKDLDLLLDEKMKNSYNEKKYYEFTLYAIIRPALFAIISFVSLYLLLYLVFL